MQKRYDDLIRHIPSLEDQGDLSIYYGVSYSDECLVYSDKNGDGNLILFYEYDDL